MGKWHIVKPLTMQNIFENPSFERSTAGWSITDGSLTRIPSPSFDVGLYGSYCIRTRPNASSDYATSPLFEHLTVDPSVSIFGGHIRSVGGVAVSVYYGPQLGGGTWTTDSILIAQTSSSDPWTQFAYAPATNDGYFFIFGQADIDAMFGYGGLDTYTTTDYPTYTYFDGDQPGAFWTGTPHGSKSGVTGQRAYGEIINLDDYSAYVTEVTGAGMAQVENSYSEIAQQPGAVFASQSVPVRTFALKMELIGTSLADLHSKRKALIDLLKLDAYPGNQPFRLVYYGANPDKPVYIDCYLAGGLEYQHAGGDGHTEDGVICRLQAPDPFFYEFGNGAAALGYRDSSSDYNKSIGFSQYPSTAPGFFSHTFSLLKPEVDEYNARIVGHYSDTGGNFVGYFQSDNVLVAVGGAADGNIQDVAVAPNGDIYAAGSFVTAAGSSDAINIAQYSFSSSSWLPLGTGINNTCSHLLVGHDGYLYAAGQFTSAGGVANTNGIARWTGTAWEALGSTGIPSTDVITAMAVAPNGDIYIGGAPLSSIGGVAVTNLARWNYSSSSYEAVSTGVNSNVRSIVADVNGDIYIGGEFTTAGGDTDCVYVCKWNGNEFVPLQNGLVSSGVVYTLGLLDGQLYIGANDANYLWNGYSFTSPPFTFTYSMGGLYVHSMAYSRKLGAGIITFNIGADTRNDLEKLTTVTVTNTRKVPAKIKARSTDGRARLVRVRNNTAEKNREKNIYFDYDAALGEYLEIDTVTGRMTSSYFGNVTGRGILRGSQFTTFELLPGPNLLTSYIDSTGSANVEFTIEWPLRHWSLDGSAT